MPGAVRQHSVMTGLTLPARRRDRRRVGPPRIRRRNGVAGWWWAVVARQEQAMGGKWRYVHFAVDGVSGDLLHINVYETCDGDSVRLFLKELRALGLRPKAVVTDMLSAYHGAIAEVFGFCIFS